MLAELCSGTRGRTQSNSLFPAVLAPDNCKNDFVKYAAPTPNKPQKRQGPGKPSAECLVPNHEAPCWSPVLQGMFSYNLTSKATLLHLFPQSRSSGRREGAARIELHGVSKAFPPWSGLHRPCAGEWKKLNQHIPNFPFYLAQFTAFLFTNLAWITLKVLSRQASLVGDLLCVQGFGIILTTVILKREALFLFIFQIE